MSNIGSLCSATFREHDFNMRACMGACMRACEVSAVSVAVVVVVVVVVAVAKMAAEVSGDGKADVTFIIGMPSLSSLSP